MRVTEERHSKKEKLNWHIFSFVEYSCKFCGLYSNTRIKTIHTNIKKTFYKICSYKLNKMANDEKPISMKENDPCETFLKCIAAKNVYSIIFDY